ncbi:MAG: STAS-like domain-containing protein, partial [Candidatus Omnitrophica bacterium]|nr:STAS-like domain-containing protein [Candidatus Omnitrophota bacterium]
EGANYVSRSQARRVLAGLEKFKTVVLDFKGIEAIGQAFADEIFRVWKSAHTDKEISARNACENVMFMVKRAE